MQIGIVGYWIETGNCNLCNLYRRIVKNDTDTERSI